MEKHPVRRLKVEGWKSFRSVDLTFDNCTVLIGSNGAGKSNLVSVFDFFRAITERRLASYCAAHGRAAALLHYGPKHTPNIRLHFGFAPPLQFDVGLFPLQTGLLGIDFEALVWPQIPPKITPPDSQEPRYLWDLDSFDRPRTYQFHDTSTHSRIRAFADIHQTQ